MPGPPVVDNTPLVAFHHLGRLDLFEKLFGVVLVPPAVRREFLAIDVEEREAALDAATWLQVREIEDERRILSFADLDRGEAEVLSLAAEQDSRLAILDERRARRRARRLGFRLVGSLGLLLLAKEKGELVSVREAVDRLVEAGFFFDRRLIEEVLEREREASEEREETEKR